MAKVKNLLKHILVEAAERKRRCHHSRSHEIVKGTKCLVVVDERGGKRNYCSICAEPMLEEARRKVIEFGSALGEHRDK